MFATKKFRDVFGFLPRGIAPGLYATGSTAGTAIQVAAVGGASRQHRRFASGCFIGQDEARCIAAVTTTWNAWIYAAGSELCRTRHRSCFRPARPVRFPAPIASPPQGRARGVWISHQHRHGDPRRVYRGAWVAISPRIKPVMSITGASAFMALLSLGFGSRAVSHPRTMTRLGAGVRGDGVRFEQANVAR